MHKRVKVKLISIKKNMRTKLNYENCTEKISILFTDYTTSHNTTQCCFIFDTTTLDKYPNKSLPYLGFGNRQNKLQLKWSHRTVLIKPRSSVQMLRSNKKKVKSKYIYNGMENSLQIICERWFSDRFRSVCGLT